MGEAGQPSPQASGGDKSGSRVCTQACRVGPGPEAPSCQLLSLSLGPGVRGHIHRYPGGLRATLGLCPPPPPPWDMLAATCSGTVMSRPTALLALTLAALLAPGAGVPIREQAAQHKLLLVSFDGFRWDYDQDVDTPNLDAMARDGVKARYMTPAFVTMTSPCHFTLVTGKYIENHGVVHNMFYNTTSKVKLPYHATLGIERWWDNGSVPIWVTAQRQGLKTGSFFYPGGNVTYQGVAVTQSRKEGVLHNYKDEQEWRANIDTVISWFTQDGLDLVTLYFGEPDSTGHKFGPKSAERKDIVRQVDRTVGYLRERIRQSGLADSLNLIITSDHGMTTVNKTASDLVEFHKFPNFTFKDIEFELLDYGPNGMLLPKEGLLDKVYEVLKEVHPKLHVYRKESFPKSFHYANHPRITPLLMYSDSGYVIHGRVNVQFNNGEHGFDNGDLDMKTIFRAVGPSFRAGLEVAPFESVHVYELMCRLLGIVPEPNDGDPGTLLPLLRPDQGGMPASSAPTPPPPTAPTCCSPPGPTQPPSGYTGAALQLSGRSPLVTVLAVATILLVKIT
ncbi:ectonucleotide pyrophosphatase/phosphodiesterase family member 7 [Orycteropus afer afer]|uniref:Ectonucleotide pyrophosphatase/phosphodiesterase family member 7 n=1 Tax=Orycteropus afer afer TaxID=1230840 RepID=A0A8B7BE78_ORYAF|nr:ectonucleotide pyrophosphatase/phosphodiesterase family member 7 [Orycteropus afer afer]